MFSFEDGFFIFPALSHDPESIIYGFKHTPMVKFIEDRQVAISKTPFMDGSAYFWKVEQGLWVIYTSIKFKKNICFRNIYDPEGSADYFTLNLDVETNIDNILHSQEGQKFKMDSYYWRLFKPNSISSNYYFKGSYTKLITLYIHKDWMYEHLINKNSFGPLPIKWLENPTLEGLLLPQSTLTKSMHVDQILSALEGQEKEKINEFEMRINILSLINSFITTLNTMDPIPSVSMKPKDEARIIKAERMLKDAVYNGFPSIQLISKEIGISETKLKSEFKLLFGKTLYQYYSECQMDVAEELINRGQHSIKSIAYMLGYQHPGKFSAAYKKIKGVLPSENRL